MTELGAPDYTNSSTLQIGYQFAPSRAYQYDGILVARAPVSMSFNFMANATTADGLVPYGESTLGRNDTFFQSLITRFNLEFQSASVNPNFREAGENQYVTWTENYMENLVIQLGNILYYDIDIVVNMGTWRNNFIDFVNYSDTKETRRARQTYGLNPVSGSLRAKTKQLVTPDDLDLFFAAGTDFTKIKVTSRSVTEVYEDKEKIYSVSLSWRSNDITSPAQFWV